MCEKSKIPASLPEAMDHVQAFMLMEDMQYNLEGLCADLAEFRSLAEHLGLLDIDKIANIAR